jgi:hypothetical protein
MADRLGKPNYTASQCANCLSEQESGIKRSFDLMSGSTQNRFSAIPVGRLGLEDHVEIGQEPSLVSSEEHAEPWVIYV